jgi:glucosyl-dolichyl phosphate glucuronosyltransferase
LIGYANPFQQLPKEFFRAFFHQLTGQKCDKIYLIMKISVVVCTYNRWVSLEKTLESFQEISSPESFSWELILVDNNSQDNTQVIAEKFIKNGRLKLQYVFEEQQGLSYARNRGIKHARGEIIAFTDDDVIIDQHWLLNIHKAFTEYQASCVGGKILPIWEIPKPKWLMEDLYHVLALLDYGDNPFYMKSPLIWGANLAVKADMFDKYGLFNINLGRTPEKLTASEEYDFLKRLLDGGENILYYPKAVIYHCIPENRITKNYFRRWKFYNAESTVVRLRFLNSNYLWILPYSRMIKILLNGILYSISLLTLSPARFKYELQIIHDLSFIYHVMKPNQ